MVPHLTTALTGPLLDLEQRILDRMPDIEHWLRTQWQEYAVPFYTSVDLPASNSRRAQLAAAIGIGQLCDEETHA
jgi:glutamate--cysteine ligase